MFDQNTVIIVGVIALAVGVFMGSLAGVFMMALCQVAHGADAHLDNPQWRPDPKEARTR